VIELQANGEESYVAAWRWGHM